MTQPERTVLYEKHLGLKAKMTEFAGFLMPLQYTEGILAEHLQTRSHAGLFDVSHMGRLVCKGKDAEAFLSCVCSFNPADLAVGKAHYTILPTKTGGAVDDAFLYRLEQNTFLLVVNASNRQAVVDHFNKYVKEYSQLDISDTTASTAMLSLQGPQSEQVLAAVLGSDKIPPTGRNTLAADLDDRIFVSRTGYAGEPLGFEIILPCEAAVSLWDSLIQQGAHPVGLGARDTLRIEASLPLYGHELGQDSNQNEIPVFAIPQARIAVDLKDEHREFIGKKRLLDQMEAANGFANGDYSLKESLPKMIKAFSLIDSGIARPGDKVIFGGIEVGVVTSGTMIPYYKFIDDKPVEDTAKRAIGMCLVDSDLEMGSQVDLEVRGRQLKAVIVNNHLQTSRPPYAVPVIHHY